MTRPFLRLGLFYAVLYMGTGVASPYMPLWFQDGGLSSDQIGWILATPLIGRIVSGPLLALLADALGSRRSAIAALMATTALAYGAMAWFDGFWPWAIGWFVASSAMGVCSPLLDVIALRRAREAGVPYAFPRGIGSLAYILASLAAGALCDQLGSPIVIVLVLASAVTAAICVPVLLPSDPPSHVKALSARDRGRAVARLARSPDYLLVILTYGLLEAGHAFYAFAPLIWRDQGLDPTMIGLLWGCGVLAELGFFWLAESWRARLGPHWLLVIGAVAAILRWSALALSPPLILLFPLQLLNALTFSAPFIATLHLVERSSAPEAASVAQAGRWALSTGFLKGLAVVGSGFLFAAFGAGGFLFMTGLASAGCALALLLLWRARHPSTPIPA